VLAFIATQDIEPRRRAFIVGDHVLAKIYSQKISQLKHETVLATITEIRDFAFHNDYHYAIKIDLDGVVHDGIWLQYYKLIALDYQVGQKVKQLGIREPFGDGKVVAIRKNGKEVVYDVEFPATCELKASDLAPVSPSN
jgi:hypothetical protein